MGADPSLIGASTWLDMAGELEEGGLGMKSIADNLVDRIWTEEDGREPFTVIKTFTILYCTVRWAKMRIYILPHIFMLFN